ncbi:Protein C-Ets-1 [Manis pentadactyla]|nr:Protein C-Ets-1 [Manis pentadactyla]
MEKMIIPAVSLLTCLFHPWKTAWKEGHSWNHSSLYFHSSVSCRGSSVFTDLGPWDNLKTCKGEVFPSPDIQVANLSYRDILLTPSSKDKVICPQAENLYDKFQFKETVEDFFMVSRGVDSVVG